MDFPLDTDFPKHFGKSPDDFLQKYTPLIYKTILYYKNIYKHNIDPQDLFQEFFIHIEKNYYEKLMFVYQSLL